MHIHEPSYNSEQRSPNGTTRAWNSVCGGVSWGKKRSRSLSYRKLLFILACREQWLFSKHDLSTLIHINLYLEGLMSLFWLYRLRWRNLLLMCLHLTPWSPPIVATTLFRMKWIFPETKKLYDIFIQTASQRITARTDGHMGLMGWWME